MAVTTYKQLDSLIGIVSLLHCLSKHRKQPLIIVAGIAAYVRHQHIDIFYAETVELAERIAHIAAIHIAIDGTGGL